MEATKKLKVECPYEILKIEDIKIFCKPNEHGKVYLKCLIDDSVNFKYSIEASTNDKICVYEEIENTDLNNNENTSNEEKRTIIFNGIIENIKTTNINGIYYLELEGSSSSSLLDIEKRTRSFQDINMSYDELINEILKNYEGYGFAQCMNRPMSIEKPLFQYKETDYEFLKRIGSYLGLELICDVVNTNNIIYFGKPSLKFYALNNEINYKASKDLEKYYKVLTLGIDFHDTDFFYYEVMLREKMDIGDLIKFKERDFYINQYYGQMHNRELIYKYRFCRKNGIWQEKIYNEKLSGISIEGKVLAVDGERVKLHLNIDETQDISKASWFKYAPPTGNIMYAMPNIGESVMLYFPNRYDEPIVTGCVRKNGNSCSKISNTNNRYFSTESGNNLDILPGAINFYRGGMNVNLNDENGINISSSGNLSLGASGGISLSGGSVSISGSNKVLVQKNKSSYISLEGECYNQSNAVYENGSCRETYEKFTDDEPTAGVQEALAELEYKNELLSLSILGSNVMLNVVMQNDMYNGIPKSGVALKNRSDIEVFDSKKVYKGTLVKTQAGDDEFILGKAYPTCNGSVFVPVDVNLASKHTGSFKKHLQSFGNAFMGVATKGYYDTLALGASLDGILSFDQDKRLNAMSASAEYTEEGKKANEYYKNKSQYKQAYDAYSIDINLFMAVKGIGNICKSPGNISNMGGGSLPILNGTKGTLAISSSVKIADIGVVVRTGIGGAELGLGAYNFSKGSNNGSSKETDKNNNATNKKNYEKESSSNNKGKNIENKVQGNETKVNNGARYGKQKISDKLYNKLRRRTPTTEIRDMVNEGVNLPMDDFALPGKRITSNLEADHIVSMKKIVKMEGFEKLSYEQQLSILNYEENFIGLSKIANTSKGSKSYEEWILYKKGDIEVDSEFRKRMIRIERELEGRIQRLIDDFLK